MKFFGQQLRCSCIHPNVHVLVVDSILGLVSALGLNLAAGVTVLRVNRGLFPAWSGTGCDLAPNNLPKNAFPGPGKKKKPYISLIHKAFCLFWRFPFLRPGVEEGARTLDLRNHNPTL